ncbi:GerMN domain-containing protein [Paenibacillus pini]|nr:GerMN domain-containing protein [Paenibacillus pini]
MTKYKKIRGFTAAGLLAVPVMLSGCNLVSTNSSKEVDPPPSQVEQQMLNASQGVMKQMEQTGVPTTVYLTNDHGMLAPVSLGIPATTGTAHLQGALESLVADGKYADYLPEGFAGVLPAGTEVKNVTVQKDKKMAVVEFNKDFEKYKAPQERKILEAITWTLTGNPNVEKVQLWVDGQKLSEMPVNGTPLDESLTRSIGINLQQGDGASLMDSSPVTVYFSAMSPAETQYYVPVTRLVKTGQDSVKAALNELIRGPQENDGLERVMSDVTALKDVKKAKDGTVTVSLKDDMFAKDEKVPLEFLQSVVLTVAENAGNPKVKIQLNGESKVVGYDNQDYSQPVSRPQYINQIPL